MQARSDDCEHRITYREYDTSSILTKREQDFAMIASMPQFVCKRLQLWQKSLVLMFVDVLRDSVSLKYVEHGSEQEAIWITVSELVFPLV